MADLRILPLDAQERAMSRSPGAGVLYIGGLKKSLLQSCPYLVLLAIPALALFRRTKDAESLAILFLVPIAFIGFYSHFSWHGGLCLNLRYFTATLPYTSILSAYALRCVTASTIARPSPKNVLPVFLVLVVFLFSKKLLGSWIAAEFFFLTLPLIFSGVLLVLLLLYLHNPERNRKLAGAILSLTLLAMTWSGTVAFLYDYPLAQRIRAYNLNTGRKAASFVSADSIFFANALDRFFVLIEGDKVRIARPTMDSFHDLPLLTEFHLSAGRRVYAAFQPQVWETLRRGPLQPFEIRPLWSLPAFALAEISSPIPSNAPSSPD